MGRRRCSTAALPTFELQSVVSGEVRLVSGDERLERLDACYGAPLVMTNGAEPTPLAQLLDAWQGSDDACAIHAEDRHAVQATEALRALVLELLQRAESRDLFNACARLGGALADAGASPSLVATTLDNAALVLARLAPPGIDIHGAYFACARASLIEGYVARVIEGERNAHKRGWEYPACSVRVDSETLAIVAGYPNDDAEGLANWAARVALGARRDGIKRVMVGGPEAARTELAQAFDMLGIAMTNRLEKGRWLRFPFCKG